MRWPRASAILDLRLRFAQARRRAESAETAMIQLARLRLAGARGRLEQALAHLTQLSPLKILQRGYAIVTNGAGSVVKEPAQAPAGSRIRVLLANGALAAEVVEPESPAGGSS